MNTTYGVTVTDAYGCSDMASVLVEVVDVRCGNNNNKVLVCHEAGNGNQNTLCVSQNGVADHLAHGDILGPCGLVVCQPYQSFGGNGGGSNALLAPAAGSVLAESDHAIHLFPNPASDRVQVEIEKDFSTGRIKVLDLQGRLAWEQNLEEGVQDYVLQTEKWHSGIYFVHIQLDGAFFTEKLIVE